jgi:hypothetical protein
MLQLLKSWRESPDFPEDWRPDSSPGAVVKEPVNNPDLKRALRDSLAGRWQKVYRNGIDGTELHYFEHASGAVTLVKHVVK